MRRALSLALACLGLLGFGGSQMGGCGSSPGGIPFIADVVVVNTPDSFTVTLVGFGYGGTVDRNWSCSGTQAKVSLGTSMFAGSVHIVIQDNAGTVVYDNTHSGTTGGITVQTKPGGVAGTWHVNLNFSNASWAGAITFNADNPQTPDVVSIGSGFGGSDSNIYHAAWDTGSAPVHVSVATGLTSGSVRVRIWDPATLTTSPASYDSGTINSASPAVSDDILTGGAGTWTIQVDFTGAVLGGAVAISN